MKTRALIALLVGMSVPAPILAAPRVVASVEGATIVRDDQARTWTIGNDLVRLTTSIASKDEYRLVALVNPVSGRKWTTAQDADTTVLIAGASVALGPAGSFRYATYHAVELANGVELRVVFEHDARRIRLVRHYAVYRHAPVAETWSSFEALPGGAPAMLEDLNAFQVVLEPGTVTWLNGLEVPEEEGGAFALRGKNLSPPERFEIGSEGRSSTTAVPWFAIESRGETLYGGLVWSGSWRLRMDAMAIGLRTSLGLPDMSTRLEPGRKIEGPHGFVGVSSEGGARVPEGMRAFIEEGLRGGRSFEPVALFNTWYGHGAAIDEETVLRSMRLGAELGTKRVVVDAGWAEGGGALGGGDFTSGLGRFSADPERFPSGLAGLAESAHELGLQFGLWVEPERVDLETVFTDGTVRAEWLARRDGSWFPPVSDQDAEAAQLCLGDPDAREWLLGQLSGLIETTGLDHLKWDNNDWVDCNRDDHGHGPRDGNFAHVSGLYEVLAALRERFPDLVIENCAGGGRRMDFGMARYTDLAWMDDRTSPSALVRRNLSRLSTLFPPAYLLSFVVDAEEERLHESFDVPLLVRSRMPGALGISISDRAELDEAERGLIAAEVGAHGSIAHIIGSASAVTLAAEEIGWEVTEHLSNDRRQAVVFAFQAEASARRLVLKPVGLLERMLYRVRSLDAGGLGARSGADLMKSGIEIEPWGDSAARVLVIEAVRQLRRPPRL